MTGATPRFALIVSALFSFFLFPYPYTLALAFVASIFVPWFALALGLLYDALFMIPHEGSVPLASILGAVSSLLAHLVRRFVKARIMGG